MKMLTWFTDIEVVVEREWKDLKPADREDAQAPINVNQAKCLVDEVKRLEDVISNQNELMEHLTPKITEKQRGAESPMFWENEAARLDTERLRLRGILLNIYGNMRHLHESGATTRVHLKMINNELSKAWHPSSSPTEEEKK
jgi:hypothetical protein